jgi:DNA-binding transcriptional LysR family regulator
MARLVRKVQGGFDVAIKHIRAVNSVALYGSFTAAAADLGMTQSAVSRLVLQLEKQLGVSLFLRSTNSPPRRGDSSTTSTSRSRMPAP